MFPSPENPLLASLQRAGAWLKAFALLEDETRGDVPPHPHRTALAAPARDRRPGVVSDRPDVCLSPVGGVRTPARAPDGGRAARRAARH